MLLYSNHDENASYKNGVALLLFNEARNTLIWKSHGSRIIIASFKTKGITTNVIQCYAPTNDSNDDDKDQFNDKLQSIVVNHLGNKLTTLMGDLHANVGKENIEYEDIMERHGLEERSESGLRFANLHVFSMIRGGTISLHKRIPRTKWVSPDHTTENQTDHIYISKKFGLMEDVRTRRGADIASDHHLVVTKMKLKLNKQWAAKKQQYECSIQPSFKIMLNSTNSR
ncbi:unnamed protein product [Schistosoma margrebowiei]|uniref:Uncharacterized protein n=1 Tax=Schistosoma margrebowiei TaxID=48269 RepID=A0A183MXJ2_9TREM|nr:unnamed protein product [Schistosoma margrebowiei]